MEDSELISAAEEPAIGVPHLDAGSEHRGRAMRRGCRALPVLRVVPEEVGRDVEVDVLEEPAGNARAQVTLGEVALMKGNVKRARAKKAGHRDEIHVEDEIVHVRISAAIVRPVGCAEAEPESMPIGGAVAKRVGSRGGRTLDAVEWMVDGLGEG